MLGDDFNKWSVTLVANDILISLGMHVSSLQYLENGLSQFIELSDSGNKESNRSLMGFDKQTLFVNNKQLPTFDDSDVKQIRRKKATSKR